MMYSPRTSATARRTYTGPYRRARLPYAERRPLHTPRQRPWSARLIDIMIGFVLLLTFASLVSCIIVLNTVETAPSEGDRFSLQAKPAEPLTPADPTPPAKTQDVDNGSL